MGSAQSVAETAASFLDQAISPLRDEAEKALQRKQEAQSLSIAQALAEVERP